VDLSSTNKVGWNLTDLQKIEQKPVKVMTTFSCGGGSSMGYKLNGFDVLAANDIDPEMQYHYVKNLNPKHYFLCPIKDLINQQLPDELYDLDILDGSPPCSTFSTAGSREKAWGIEKHFREGQAKQVLSDLFFDFIDLANHLKPKVVIAENVKGMLLGNAKGYTKAVMRRFEEIGYKAQLFLINAADCGVPQKRERVFFCCVRKELSKKPLKLMFKHRWIPVKQALKDLGLLTHEEILDTKPSGIDLKYWHLTDPGSHYGKAKLSLEGKEGCWSHKRLDGNMPSRTLVATHEVIKHYSECRSLTFREWKRLGSFPDDYQAKNDKIGKYMIGMSVPPLMIKEVSKQIYDQWLK
jgi:DNA (cytosine-5)-methyltransferase 1